MSRLPAAVGASALSLALVVTGAAPAAVMHTHDGGGAPAAITAQADAGALRGYRVAQARTAGGAEARLDLSLAERSDIQERLNS
ncbi:MAG: hypothetical protein GWO02_05360, partial [Gammaproteobacteria bacterium]|nr:hypothetical protein [Gammaproteobacteria bacterium]